MPKLSETINMKSKVLDFSTLALSHNKICWAYRQLVADHFAVVDLRISVVIRVQYSFLPCVNTSSGPVSCCVFDWVLSGRQFCVCLAMSSRVYEVV